MFILTFEKFGSSNISQATASKRLFPEVSLMMNILKASESDSPITSFTDSGSIEPNTISLSDSKSNGFEPSLLNSSSLDNRLSTFSETKYGLFSEISSLFLSRFPLSFS